MPVVSMNYLLEAGVHFGHQTKRWNPKMKEYIFAARDDIYIIDLQQTAKKIEEAYEVLNQIAKDGGKVLFVGTKKQAQEAIKEEALRTEMFFVNERWLGGTLTNFKTIRQRIYRMEDIEKMEKDGTFEKLPKKEVIKIRQEYEKLDKYLSGIRSMKKLPEALVIVDPRKENSAIREARRLNIPIIGIVDTNCDPDDVDYVIPANDDAVRAVKVVIGVLGNAINQATGGPITDYITEEDKNRMAKAAVIKNERKLEEEKKTIQKEIEENQNIAKQEVEAKATKEKEAIEIKIEETATKEEEEETIEIKVAKETAPKEEKKTVKKAAPKEEKKTVKKAVKETAPKEEKKTVKKAVKKEVK